MPSAVIEKLQPYLEPTTPRAELIARINDLRRVRNAVILAHNYQVGDIQDLADFVGDSLELSRRAAETDAAVIVFCGVHFMAETAKLLNPDKIVVLPDVTAGCGLSDMLTREQLVAFKAKHPGVPVVCYVNTSAEVKAESDICCTSSNAVEVVKSLGVPKVLFVPDKHLAHWVAQHTDVEVIAWDGYCPVHQRIFPEDVVRLKAEHPAAEVVVHPECPADVIAVADKVFSTGGMMTYVREAAATEFIIGTEVGIVHRMQKENPHKRFYVAQPPGFCCEGAFCEHMKKNTLERLAWCLEDLEPRVEIPEAVAAKARTTIERMLAVR